MSRLLTYAGGVAFLLVTLALVVGGSMSSDLVVLGVVAALVLLVVIGPERAGVLALGAAFATAPMYKRLAPAGSPITPTDVALVVGFALMLPRLLRNKFDLPVQYVVAGGVIFATGLIGSFTSDQRAVALLALGFWMATMFVLPTGVHLWRPSSAEIQLMGWLFVAGQAFSYAYGMATGASYGGRFYGLTIHPNYFAEAGLLSFALLMHLASVTPSRFRWITRAAMAFSVYTVFISGSRAGMLGLAAVVVIIPVVERSTIRMYLLSLLAAGGAVFVSMNPSLLTHGALGRLTGHGSASGSDEERTRGLVQGWHRFLDHPLSGSGLTDLFDVHNNYLEVAIGVGIFGLVAFIVVLYTLVGPLLLGTHPLRRLSYTVLAYGVFGATIPSLYDRTMWVPMSLSVVAVAAHRRRHEPPDGPPGIPGTPPQGQQVVTMLPIAATR